MGKFRRLKVQQARLDAAFLRANREDARVKQNSKCDYCFDPITAKTATADHVVAQAVYGKDHRNNIVAACRDCNQAKGHRPVAEFRRMIERPKPGEHVRYRLINFRLRINRRLALMERRVMRAVGRSSK